MNEEDLIDHSLRDEDSCSSDKIENYFSNRYIEIKSFKICKDPLYCSSILAGSDGHNVASVLSNGSVIVIDKETSKIVNTYKPHKKEVTEAIFSPLNDNILYSSSLEGKIKLWDFRSNSVEKEIDANTDGRRPLTTFDVSPQERLLSAGTELIGEDSFILFWDLRASKLLGGYWESHSDDISYIRFNPDHSSTMASSGLDGLINVFDTSQPSEDSAFTYCLNTNDVVKTFSWRSLNRKTNILAYTDVLSIQLWDIEESGPSLTFSREQIAKSLHRSVPDECYPVHMNYSFDKNPVILAGSGLEHSNESCLRTLKINEKNGCLEPHGLLVPTKGKVTSITQCAFFESKTQSLITISEDGNISFWKSKESDKISDLKIMNNKGRKKIKPY